MEPRGTAWVLCRQNARQKPGFPEVTEKWTLNLVLGVVAEEHEKRGNEKGATGTAGGRPNVHSTREKSNSCSDKMAWM